MSMMGKVGRRAGGFSRATVPLGLAGLGLALAGAGDDNRGLAGTALDGVMDAMFYSPELEDLGGKGSDIDNRLLGRDIGLEDLYTPLQRVDPRSWGGYRDLRNAFRVENIRNMSSAISNENRIMAKATDKYARQTQIASSRMYGDDQYWDEMFGIPYAPSVQRTPYSSGDMVFGAYNRRHR